MKYFLYEDGGEFRTATVLSETDTSLQAETTSGKRAKIRSAHVVLRFDRPAPEVLLPAARELAESMDIDFLWECAPREDFGFEEFAAEYFGAGGGTVEAVALLLKLHAAPVYFHRRGRGRFRPAPPEVLQSALATLERRRREQEQIEVDAEAMRRGELPEMIARQAAQLLVRPDRNSAAWKALERALSAEYPTPERLLCRLGAFPSPREMHVARFQAEHFPQGFAAVLPADPLAGVQRTIAALPLAAVDAFSIDDASTTEVDDCLSVQPLATGGWRVGVHVAAPGLVIGHGDEADLLARARMATVYLPGDKITMLPEALLRMFSLDAGREAAVLSLYVDTDAAGEQIVARTSRVERLAVTENLRHEDVDHLFDRTTLESPGDERHPRSAQFRVLWRLVRALAAAREQMRGKPEPRFAADFSFHIDRDGDTERVRIEQRRRDIPLERIVSEAMILANSEWARLLSLARVPGVFRAQQAGRVRTTTHAAPHLGIGVSQYMWSTSPLRRYVDLVNQRQTLAVLAGRRPPLAANDTDLFSIVSAFEARYGAYLDFQQRMERYWCLRWLAQEQLRRVSAVVVREDVVRLVEAPLYFPVPNLPPDLAPGRKVLVEVLDMDEIDLSVQARFIGIDVEVDETSPIVTGIDGDVADAPLP